LPAVGGILDPMLLERFGPTRQWRRVRSSRRSPTWFGFLSFLGIATLWFGLK